VVVRHFDRPPQTDIELFGTQHHRAVEKIIESCVGVERELANPPPTLPVGQIRTVLVTTARERNHRFEELPLRGAHQHLCGAFRHHRPRESALKFAAPIDAPSIYRNSELEVDQRMATSQVWTEVGERRNSKHVAQLPVVLPLEDFIYRLPVQQEAVLDRVGEAVIGELREVASDEVSVDHRTRAFNSTSENDALIRPLPLPGGDILRFCLLE